MDGQGASNTSCSGQCVLGSPNTDCRSQPLESHPMLHTEGEDVLPFAKRQQTAGAARLVPGRKCGPLRTDTSPAAGPGVQLVGQKGAALG